MPIPFLRSTSGPRAEFYCSACQTKFKPQSLSTDMAAIQAQWDEHLSSAHPRHWEREEGRRARRRASRERSATRWCLIIAFSVLGFVVSVVGYLWIAYLHASPRVVSVFFKLCPPSVLTLIYIDVPGTSVDYAVTWAEVAVLNAGLYGVIGAAVSRLFRIGRLVD